MKPRLQHSNLIVKEANMNFIIDMALGAVSIIAIIIIIRGWNRK